jgi:hypothetical protein
VLAVEQELRRWPAGDRSWFMAGYREGHADMNAGRFNEAKAWLAENEDRADEPTFCGYLRAINDCLGGEK